MAQAKTSEDLSLVNPSNQLDHEEILSNWDEYLAPAPMGIFIMSQLLICSTRVKDFAINSIIEEGKATKIDKKYINLLIHPESFYRTLVQIVNESYEAFMLAHTNMDKIQLQMTQVPDDVKECVELIQFNDKNAIKKFLPRRLKRIKEAAADGLKYSEQVHDAFDRLGPLIQQVILAITASKGAREREIAELIRKSIEEKKNRQEEYIRKEQDRLKKEIEGAQEAEQPTPFGIPFLVRGATSYLNKTQAENWLQRIKEEAKVENEKRKICDDYINSLKNLQITIGKEINKDEIIKLLNEGTTKLGEMHEKWAGMIKYFESINRFIGRNPKKYLVDFVNDANDVQHDISLLEFMDESMEKSLESSTKSHRIAATYVKVSENYLMEPLKRMHGMLSIESHKLEETQDELLELCKKAMKGIQDMGNEDRNQTIREIENKLSSKYSALI